MTLESELKHEGLLLGCLLRIAAIKDSRWRRHFNNLDRALKVHHHDKRPRDAERLRAGQLYTALELFEDRPIEGIALDLECDVRTVQRWIKEDLLHVWESPRRDVSRSQAPDDGSEELDPIDLWAAAVFPHDAATERSRATDSTESVASWQLKR